MNAKTTLLWAMAMMTAATARAEDSERVALDDLPQPVQQTLRSRHDGAVREVTRRNVDGREIYIVEIERNNAPNPRLRIAADGTLVGEFDPMITPSGEMAAAPTTYANGVGMAPVYSRLSLSDLPEAVQKTATAQAAGREIADIDQESWEGRRVYEIEFKERGLNSRVYVGEDGRVVRSEQRGANPLKSFFMGTQLEDTPAAVQDAIRRVAGSQEVTDIDRENSNGEAVYRVEIGRDENKREVHVSADGKVLFDSRSPDQPPRG